MFFRKNKINKTERLENPENIISELTTLGKMIKEKSNFKELLTIEFPYATYETLEYHYNLLNYNISRKRFNINLGNISYGVEEEADRHIFVYIKVEDIVIYHNAKENCNSRLFENLKSGWNHNSPKKLLEQISNDIMIFRNAIDNINKNKGNKWIDEQSRLDELFK